MTQVPSVALEPPSTPPRPSPSRLVGLGAVVMVLIGLLLLYLLTQATNNQMYEQNYAQLVTVNVVVAGILVLAIVWVGVRLYTRMRQGRFGSRLLV